MKAQALSKDFLNHTTVGSCEATPGRKNVKQVIRQSFLYMLGATGCKWVGLESYIAHMKDWQKDIYFLAGAYLEEIERTPFLELERENEKDVDVLHLVDPIDEYMFQQIREFSGKQFASIAARGCVQEEV